MESKSDSSPKTALPRIKLPPFSGAYEDWPSFRDLFLSLVGENPSVSNIERFHYLRSCVKGSAEKLIRSLTVTSENYDRAWAILAKHFENKKELMRSNFATFTAVGKMKSESAEELSRVHHAVTATVNAQESIGRPINSHGMDLLNHLVIELFDSRTRLEWESSTSDSPDPPSHEALTDFISKRILTLNAAKPKIAVKSAGEASRTAKTHFAKNVPDASKCAACKGKHTLMQCPEFKSKSASERKSFVEVSGLCFNCLGNHMMARCQSIKTCFTCKLRHHTLLHDAYAAPTPQEASTFSTTRTSLDKRATLLATARVTLTDRLGRPQDVRALLDQGSEVSLVSEDLAQRLRLTRTRSSISIVGIGGACSGSTRGRVTLALKSRVTGAPLTVAAYVLPRLSSYQGPAIKGSTTWPHIHGLTLADPHYLQRDPIHLLLGADAFSGILLGGLRKGRKDQPIAQRTTFGWILSGGCGVVTANGSLSSLQCTVDHDLNALVQRFWEQEQEQPASVVLTPEEEQCEEIFARTHERLADGRYLVRLPLAGPLPPLEHTRKSAERLLAAMERRRSRDAGFNKLYGSFMEEYSDLQHMTLVRTPLIKKSACYLPHHGVLRTSSTTTKLRVVFNGSQCTPAGDSLNNALLVGANLLPTLADVLLRWRWHRFAFIADIEKMYRQILVHPDDRDLQRILWRQNRTDDVQEYRLNTVTYGLACAPFLAIRTLRQLADDEEPANPAGAVALRRDCYVDDIVTGASTLSEAVEKQRQLRRLCTAGGFPLRKWASNHQRILEEIPREHQLQQPHHDWEDEAHPTLGLRWHPRSDSFTFRLQPRTTAPLTKRQALSETAQIFDPLGWLAPVTARAKILIQSAWMKQLDWDAPLPQSDETLWRRLLEDLPLLEQLRLHRWLRADDQPKRVELHGFADASERGYAAVVYLRVVSSPSTTIKLLAAKSKVAPIKPVSLPRLELCAAVLVTNLTFHLREALDLLSAPVTLWSDSRVTLQWIQGHASRWKTFVANRVSHIQTKLPETRWRHIPGRDNPADCASRGIEPRDLLNHSLWWTGPPWLDKDPASWPQHDHAAHEVEVPETRAIASHLTTAEKAEPEMLLRFSELHRLLRVTAWCCRWRGATSRPKAHPNLTPDELEEALLLWLRMVQTLHFSKEIAALKQNKELVRGPLSKLTPFLDDHGIIRVGGRLKHAVLSGDERHPMILPPESWMTQLLVKAHHRRTLHGGVQLTLGLLRLRYWIPRGRSIVKGIIHRCVTCVRWKAAVPQPMMSSLPTARVTPARPFLRTGVDYAGPILIRTEKEEVTRRTKRSSPSSSASPPRRFTWKPLQTTPRMRSLRHSGASLPVGACARKSTPTAAPTSSERTESCDACSRHHHPTAVASPTLQRPTGSAGGSIHRQHLTSAGFGRRR
ncbi:uncharacterized protein LOC112637250 [Camponotus floridanus]|uniref:uncharacterized protein LOC112637250 n=1 Tax=Camponotus floridanus TaxID=104421 RepID=UPI000DC691F3|nr:uncharacterized protein LOC112637250 [Camponotus floridanus]